jgi:GTP-binding protein YchF
MGFTCGIIGLPNVGKSTIFNALTSAKAQSANFPFCTIEPNTGAVAVPDERLLTLAKMAASQKIIPAQITFVDVAGLIKGASQGEGLGNQFLGHIRGVDAIVHVVRCFDDENITHVEGSVDPIRDIATIETELMLSDLETLRKATDKIQKLAKSGDKEARTSLEIISELEEILDKGGNLREAVSSRMTEEPLYARIGGSLICSKPLLYVANVSEEEMTSGVEGKYVGILKKQAEQQNVPLVVISGQLEAEVAELPLSERQDYIKELGLGASGLDRLANAGYRLLDLVTFFTIGPKEAHAWTARRGSKAPQCAGKIHTDFERGFIRAEVISCEDYISAGSELKAREAGRLRVEGKEYEVQDGDIVHFRFNV